MKKTLLALLVVMLLSPTVAFAAGKLTVSEEIFIVLPYSSYHAGYVYAELENTGDKPVEYNGGLVEFFDEDGNSIESESPYRMYPNVLEPGEKGYLMAYQSVKEATDKSYIDDYLLTVTGKGSKDKSVIRYPATARLEIDNKSRYSTYYYEIATVENNTELTCYDFYAVFIARDIDGKMLHVQECDPSYVGIQPGSFIEIKYRLDSDIIEYYEGKDIAIDSIDVIVFTYEED